MPRARSPEEGSGTSCKAIARSNPLARKLPTQRRAGERPLFARRPGASQEVEAAAEELLAPNANADEILGSSIF